MTEYIVEPPALQVDFIDRHGCLSQSGGDIKPAFSAVFDPNNVDHLRAAAHLLFAGGTLPDEFFENFTLDQCTDAFVQRNPRVPLGLHLHLANRLAKAALRDRLGAAPAGSGE